MEHDGRIDSRRQRRTGPGRRRGDDLQPQRPAADFYRRFPNLRQIPRRYLLAGSVLFVSYEICLALSLGYAASRQQAIEVGMVNYLWPSLTILFAILFNGQKSSWLVIPGLLLALLGVGWVLG
jgi:drug/metabolite transporter (DMT)-like permease